MVKTVATLKEFEAEAVRFAHELRPSPSVARLVTLSGVLGAGKTAFTKAVAKELGVTDHVTSPTFVLEKIYSLPRGGLFMRLVHIDAYRLQSAAELSALGFTDLLKDPGNLVFLEWPENVPDALPKERLSITISVAENSVRTIAYA